MTILDQLAAHAKERVALSMQRLPEDELRCMALSMTGSDFAFEKALHKEGLSFICECKKASPSKGIIDENFDYLQIAMDYQTA
ncbi:MAG: indole-3-glycerol-phosphate synthase TrpC, partial [Ruminococcus sp.]|nr:indole-3-glycerol-phosphate synthase TrpC [Ruminococcus sp.]